MPDRTGHSYFMLALLLVIASGFLSKISAISCLNYWFVKPTISVKDYRNLLVTGINPRGSKSVREDCFALKSGHDVADHNTKVGFLGPWGTYTEEALFKLIPTISDENLVPFATEAEVLHAVESGEVGKGVVPIENSIEGSVNATLDVLAFDTNLTIQKEIIIPIHHCLMAKPGVKIGDIKAVMSHPQTLAQCRSYLTKTLAEASREPASSNAAAVKIVAESSDRTLAAIGPKLAAKTYGLELLDEGIADFEENQTRFVLVGREPAPRTGKDKTSIVCFIYEDRPGSLLLILQEFAYRYVNLTKIQSRPTKQGLGNYCFFMDVEGHAEDEIVASALKCLKCKVREVKILGSYPMANGVSD